MLKIFDRKKSNFLGSAPIFEFLQMIIIKGSGQELNGIRIFIKCFKIKGDIVSRSDRKEIYRF